MRTVCAVAVRMGSTRLPGKTLIDVNGEPLLRHLLKRLNNCHRLDHIVVATTCLSEDDVIETYCRENSVTCFRGSPTDVLGRLTSAYGEAQATVGVVVYGDGPLIDPTIIDHAVELFELSGEFDFVGNDLKTTFPAGMEVEVFRIDSLVRSEALCADDAIREHGTLFLRQNTDMFRVSNFEASGNLRRPDLSLEVDTWEDLKVCGRIVGHLNAISSFSLIDIIDFVDAQNLSKLNQHVQRRWKEYRLE